MIGPFSFVSAMLLASSPSLEKKETFVPASEFNAKISFSCFGQKNIEGLDAQWIILTLRYGDGFDRLNLDAQLKAGKESFRLDGSIEMFRIIEFGQESSYSFKSIGVHDGKDVAVDAVLTAKANVQNLPGIAEWLADFDVKWGDRSFSGLRCAGHPPPPMPKKEINEMTVK